MNSLKLVILLLFAGGWAYCTFRMSCAESIRRKSINKQTMKNNAKSGIITASQEELEWQALDIQFNTGDRVMVETDSDTRFLLISKNGLKWYSIYSNLITYENQ